MERIVSNNVAIVNPSDRDYTKHRYILAFGAYASTFLMVWANGIEDAFDLAIEWCAEHAPGLLCTDQVNEAFQTELAQALAAGMDRDQAHEHAAELAEMDTISCSDRQEYILSWEANIYAEDPSRETILDLMRRAT